MNHLLECGYKPKTVTNNLCALKTFFKYCVEEELIGMDPAKGIPFPKQEEALPRYLEKAKLIQLRMLTEGKVLDRTIVEVLYTTGVRINELVKIQRGDISWNERSILIPKGKGKKERMVLFTRECEEYLKMHLKNHPNDTPYVFVSNVNHPNPYRAETIERWFREHTKLLGFKVTPHTLRHTFAANLARKGMPVRGIQQLLGHDSIHTTRIYAKLYDHVRKEQYDEWM
jgi:site-specific recombinase XerD